MLLAPIPYLGFRLLLLAFIVIVNGFFAASEVALLSVRESRLKQLAEQGQAGARVALSLLANRERLLSVTQVGVTLASLGLGWAGEDTMYQVMLHLFGGLIGAVPAGIVHAGSFVVGFLLITYVHVILGEVVPKNFPSTAPTSCHHPGPSIDGLLPAERALRRGDRKVSGCSDEGFGRAQPRTWRRAFIGRTALDREFDSRFRHLPEAQEEMIHHVLDLEDLQVREIMVPRNAIVSVSEGASMDEVLHVMTSQQHSRLPVYQGNNEQIVGILHYKDLLALWEDRRAAIRGGRTPRPFRIQSLLRKHRIVPETKPVLQMLTEFRTGQSHMALVVDEFGTISGLLTVEDVLEQIVGEIRDEFDETILHPPNDLEDIEIDGSTSVRDLETQYEIELPDNSGFETVAGFILWRLGHIPAVGEKVEHNGRRFTVASTERNRIARVRIEKIEPAAAKIEP